MTRKPNNKGRSEREHHTIMTRSIMDEPAWAALSSAAQSLYPRLRLEWRGKDFNNNGKIRLSTRQAADCMGVGIDTASRAFHDLQRKGFIVMTEKARLGIGGAAKSPAFELTELAAIGVKGEGQKKYKHWTMGHDFEVEKSMANNPKGRNGKTKPCHDNHDSTIINIMTKERVSSSIS